MSLTYARPLIISFLYIRFCLIGLRLEWKRK